MKTKILVQALTAASLAAAAPAFALDFSMGDVGTTLNSKVSLGTTMRLQQRDRSLIGIANGGSAFSTNGDDGNLAWGRGTLVSGVAKLTSDLSVNWRDYRLFVRGSAFANPVLRSHELFD